MSRNVPHVDTMCLFQVRDSSDPEEVSMKIRLFVLRTFLEERHVQV